MFVGVHADAHHETGRRFRDGHADVLHLVRQAAERGRHPVLHVDRREIRIATQLEGRRDGGRPLLVLFEVMYSRPSTPLMACSSGLVTADSTVNALAPV